MKREPHAEGQLNDDVYAGEDPQRPGPAQAPRWSLLSNHPLVLLSLALDPYIRLRVAAEHIGITQRSVQNILHDLEVEGLVTRERQGR
ncbi:MAG: MarR family transcriptional regulator, partial [Planctomycetota bacterium]